ncbi:hypothetical protein [Serratia fonticola]|uniref:hypothetical protein n=1 Tax=Serratia fonticola TaxID=47917 RepID=UPI0021791662|nr:hypothetical protein [Serratia fonticola]CAI1126359.1 Uncharacterised protein [Serratia fonticola]
MKLPSHKYYSLEKAAKLAGCEVSDLIHFASIGVLEICTKAPHLDLFFSFPKEEGAQPELLTAESDSILDIDREEVRRELVEDMANSTSNVTRLGLSLDDPESDLKSDDYVRFLRFTYSSEYFSVTERYNVGKRIKEIEKWSGLLAIPPIFIEDNERELSAWDDWEVSVCELSIPRCDSASISQRYQISEFWIDGWFEISRNSMYITDYEFNILCNGGQKIVSDQSSPSGRQPASKVEHLDVNKRAERFAINREGLLKAAIYILSKYPSECRGEKKEISPEKWRNSIVQHQNEVPPLMVTNEEVILRQLRMAVNGRGES